MRSLDQFKFHKLSKDRNILIEAWKNSLVEREGIFMFLNQCKEMEMSMIAFKKHFFYGTMMYGITLLSSGLAYGEDYKENMEDMSVKIERVHRDMDDEREDIQNLEEEMHALPLGSEDYTKLDDKIKGIEDQIANQMAKADKLKKKKMKKQHRHHMMMHNMRA
jgi:hypothetical protein